jgi:hypothetical protein
MSFCGKCGTKIEEGDIFCPNCGTKTGVSNSSINQTITSFKNTTRSSLSRLGTNKNLFIFVFTALVLNFILLLCPTMNISALSIVNMSFSFTGIFSTANQFMSLFGGESSSALTIISTFFKIGNILVFLSAIVMVFPLFRKGTYRAGYLIISKVAALYTFIINLLLIIIIAIAVASNADGFASFGLTFVGWLYIIVSIVWIISLFMLSSKFKKIVSSHNPKIR